MFEPSNWFHDPICTIVNGVRYTGGKVVDTVDTNGVVNGKQIIADAAAYAAIEAAMRPKALEHRGLFDQRVAVRRLETELLSPGNAAVLVGNQMLDFKKQDGVTEIEEAVQANAVERRMNDQLMAEEELVQIQLRRDAPVVVLCVNNFSNFLDLSRKVLRHIEIGIPVVIPSRFNTAQHSFRWTELLLDLMRKYDVPLPLVTFASIELPRLQSLVKAHPDSPVHFTGSRETAAVIRPWAPRLMASTSGPNTLLAVELTPAVAQAVRWSACIEHSGQCTALRHLVVPPSAGFDQVSKAFEGTPIISSPQDSLLRAEFAALYGDKKVKPVAGYTAVPGLPVAIKVSDKLPEGIQEHWREVYLDVTQSGPKGVGDEAFLSSLAAWLVKEQPIAVAVNGPLELGRRLWERTGQVVFTQGSTENPALSCQARPQDGECFGEVPPRAQMDKYTKFPMIIPSPVAAYNATYLLDHLRCQALSPVPTEVAFCRPLLEAIEPGAERGFAIVLLNYLCDAAVGPRRGRGARACLYGLQRPPIDGRKTIIRCPAGTSLGQLAPYLIPFFATNARNQVEVSLEKGKLQEALAALDTQGIEVREESEAAFAARSASAYNTVRAGPLSEYPLAGQWVTSLVVAGHAKTVLHGDEAVDFLNLFEASEKWLRICDPKSSGKKA